MTIPSTFELNRIVKAGSHILFTTPLNAHIHGPVPDKFAKSDPREIRFEKAV